MFYPRCLSLCADAIVALRRLQKYFLLPEARATTIELPVRVDDPRYADSETSTRARKSTESAGAADTSRWMSADVAMASASSPKSWRSTGRATADDVELADASLLRSSSFGVPTNLSAMTDVDADSASDVVATISRGTSTGPVPARQSSRFLADVSLNLRRGSLTVVVGPVGSGKSALIPRCSQRCTSARAPRVYLPSTARPRPRYRGICRAGGVGAIPQPEGERPVRSLDGPRAIRTRVECACMGADVELLPHGDETEIGEKGITLSGGQKQRTTIFAAIYADADLVVMDDPLSALDAHVAKDVFRKCVTEEFADKAVLLVTHQLSS